MTKIYWNDWASEAEMLRDFRIEQSALNGAKVLLASYTYQNYSGHAFVLLKKGRKLFEVNGGHSSDYGLEDQWAMEEVTKKALLHRLEKGTWGEEDGIKGVVIAALKGVA